MCFDYREEGKEESLKHPKLKIICSCDFSEFIFKDLSSIQIGESLVYNNFNANGKLPNEYEDNSEFFVYIKNLKRKAIFITIL